MGTWSVVLPGNRLYTVKARNYVCAIGQALASTGQPSPWGTLCFERLNEEDGLARDVSTGASFRAHRCARVMEVLYQPVRMPARVQVTAAA